MIDILFYGCLICIILLAMGSMLAMEISDRKKLKVANQNFWATAQNGDKHPSYNPKY